MSGLCVLRALRQLESESCVVFVSAFLTIEVAVESMRLGAFDVIEKPIAVEELLAVITRAIEPRPTASSEASTTRLHSMERDMGGSSIAQRWGGYVVAAAPASHDMKTLDAWARHAAVSCSTLCANCRLLGIRPLDAKDFARVLRALRLGHVNRCRPQVFFDVSDLRTLRALSSRSGMDLGCEVTANPVEGFLAVQQFISPSSEALACVRCVLQRLFDHDL